MNLKKAPHAPLRYTHDRDLAIRRRRQGRGFMYYLSDKRITDQETLKRVKHLAIPPRGKMYT